MNRFPMRSQEPLIEAPNAAFHAQNHLPRHKGQQETFESNSRNHKNNITIEDGYDQEDRLYTRNQQIGNRATSLVDYSDILRNQKRR